MGTFKTHRAKSYLAMLVPFSSLVSLRYKQLKIHIFHLSFELSAKTSAACQNTNRIWMLGS